MTATAPPEDADYAAAAEVIREARRIVVFTGAGMSADSAIPTFRDDEGFWQRFPADQFATWKGLVWVALRRPRKLAEFLFEVVDPIAAAEPNAGHRAVWYLEKERSVTVVTQNIDGLHQAAGSTTVWEVHGAILDVATLRGRPVRTLSRETLRQMARRLKRLKHGWLALPRTLFAVRSWLGLGLHGIHRPNLVLFGDSLAEPAWSSSLAAARDCDCLIQIGCSGMVLPAAMIPFEAKAHGATVIAIDPQPTDADIHLCGTAAVVMPRLVSAAFGARR